MLPVKATIKDLRCRLREYGFRRRLPSQRITCSAAIVIAPHPDDETLGCGGVIALKKAAGVPVEVVFLTAGGASHASCCQVDPDAVRSARRNQACRAVAHLGLGQDAIFWMGLEDGHIPHPGDDGFDEAVAELAARFERSAPTEVYCPHPHEYLPDHEAASAITQAAVAKSGLGVRLVFYTVWAWYNAPSPFGRAFDWRKGWRVDVRAVFEQKAAAMREYFDDERAPCGVPYCGRLPKSLIYCAARPNEAFFDYSDSTSSHRE